MKPIPIRTWKASGFRLDLSHQGMVGCTVESHYCAWLVTFHNAATLLLQSDYDQAAFAVACGAIVAPGDWDGTPSALGAAWLALDPSDIEWCPDDYLAVATEGAP